MHKLPNTVAENYWPKLSRIFLFPDHYEVISLLKELLGKRVLYCSIMERMKGTLVVCVCRGRI
jgi:hypothetical protein